MRPLGTVVITTHAKRVLEAHAVEKLVKLQCDPLDIPVKVCLDPVSNQRLNLLRAASMPGGEGTHRLVMHDDLIAPKGVFEGLSFILSKLPENSFVSAYCPSNNGFDRAADAGHHLLATSTGIWTQAVCFPEKHIPALVAWQEEHINPDYRIQDRPLAMFFKTHGIKALNVLPSLFQHIGAWRSTLGYPGKAGGRFRHSQIFDPDFDPTTIDWEAEYDRAYNCEWNFPMKGLFRE